MKKETAIDWFAEQYNLVGTAEHEEAKERFRDQIENAYIQGFCECDSTGVMGVDEYFKESYGSRN